MFFDMHADLWTDNLWEYEKGKNDVIRRKYKDKFIKGGLFGGIDHSTVISSIRKIDKKTKEDVAFKKEIEALNKKIFRA